MADLQFLWAAHAPHRRRYAIAMLASLDHAIHFHGPAPPAEDTLAYHIESPFAGAGRAVVRGAMWDEADGRLVADPVRATGRRDHELAAHRVP